MPVTVWRIDKDGDWYTEDRLTEEDFDILSEGGYEQYCSSKENQKRITTKTPERVHQGTLQRSNKLDRRKDARLAHMCTLRTRK